MNVNIGELNKRISFIKKITTTNNIGCPEILEEEIYERWAKVNNKSGTEIFKAGGDYKKVYTRFLIRYSKSIFKTLEDPDLDMIIRFKDNAYNIEFHNNYNYANEFIEIVCELIK